jgi:membrane protease YdiL (CAAX protease family)
MSQSDDAMSSSNEISVQSEPSFFSDPETKNLFKTRHLGWKILSWFLLGVIAANVASALLFKNYSRYRIEHDPAVVIVGLLGTWIGAMGAVFALSRRNGSGSLRRDYGFMFKAKDFLIGPLLGLGVQLISALVFRIVISVRALFSSESVKVLSDKAQNATDSLFPGHGLTRGILIVMIIVITPLVEELFFRGLIFRWLRAGHTATYAVIIGGALFALPHIWPQTWGVPSLFCLGAIFCMTAERYGRLGPSIVAHATFNAITIVAVLHTGGVFYAWPH